MHHSRWFRCTLTQSRSTPRCPPGRTHLGLHSSCRAEARAKGAWPVQAGRMRPFGRTGSQLGEAARHALLLATTAKHTCWASSAGQPTPPAPVTWPHHRGSSPGWERYHRQCLHTTSPAQRQHTGSKSAEACCNKARRSQHGRRHPLQLRLNLDPRPTRTLALLPTV